MLTLTDLLNTSALVGALYALTGPNLAAIATLAGTDIVDHPHVELYNGRKKRRRTADAFALGLNWGIGSSISIILVGGILTCGDPNEDWIWMGDWARIVMQAFVGVFSLILGIYGLVKALKNREHNMGTTADDLSFKKKSRFEEDSTSSAGHASEITEIVVNKVFTDVEELSFNSDGSGSRHRQDKPATRHVSGLDDSIVDKMNDCLDTSYRSQTNVEETLGLSEFDMRMWRAAKSLTDNIMLYADDDYSCSKSLQESVNTIELGIGDAKKQYTLSELKKPASIPILTKGTSSIQSKSDASSRQSSKRIIKKLSRCGNCMHCTPQVIAYFAGIVHGLSGPGEVLGVLPAVQLNQIPLAILYLSVFCLTSTAVMVGFSALYGSICRWIATRTGRKDGDASQRVFLIELSSACLSFVVGVIWLTLLAVGELDIIAP